MIVLDLSALRSSPSMQLRIRSRLLIPELMFHEIATAKSGKDRATHNIKKLIALSKHNIGQVFVGKDASQLIREQKESQHRLYAGTCINHLSTRFLRHPHLDCTHDWANVFQQVATTAGPTIDQRKLFLSEISRAYGSFLRRYDPAWLREAGKLNGDERDALIAKETKDHHVLGMLIHQMLRNDVPESKYLKKHWRSQILKQPDRYAIGKLARLTAWFCALQVVEDRADFRNAAEDIQYVFLSSYTGWLATEDKGMRRAASALWPRIELISTTQLFKDRDAKQQ